MPDLCAIISGRDAVGAPDDLLKFSGHSEGYRRARPASGTFGGFDIDDFGNARAELAQFLAYRPCLALLVEELPPLVIG
jgi:hypothetical protein